MFQWRCCTIVTWVRKFVKGVLGVRDFHCTMRTFNNSGTHMRVTDKIVSSFQNNSVGVPQCWWSPLFNIDRNSFSWNVGDLFSSLHVFLEVFAISLVPFVGYCQKARHCGWGIWPGSGRNRVSGSQSNAIRVVVSAEKTLCGWFSVYNISLSIFCHRNHTGSLRCQFSPPIKGLSNWSVEKSDNPVLISKIWSFMLFVLPQSFRNPHSATITPSLYQRYS